MTHWQAPLFEHYTDVFLSTSVCIQNVFFSSLTLAFVAFDVEQNGWTRHLLHFPYHCHRNDGCAQQVAPPSAPHYF